MHEKEVRKLKNVEKLEIVVLVGLMLPAIALAEAAKPQPETETATFWILIGPSGEGNVILVKPPHFEVVTYIDGWGEDAFWNAKLGGGGFLDDELGGEFTVDIDSEVPCVPYEGYAYLRYLFHYHGCSKIFGEGKPYYLYEDFWSMGIYWYEDYDPDWPGYERLMLMVETDHNWPNDPPEWQYNDDITTVNFANRPFSIVWYRYVEREIGRSGEIVGDWSWQGYLWESTEHPDETITVTVTIQKQS